MPIIKNQAVNLKTNGVKVAQRAFQILVVLLLIFPLRIFSQQQSPLIAQKTSHTLHLSREFQQKFLKNAFGFHSESIELTQRRIKEIGKESLGVNQIFINSLPTPTAFFCKKELQFQNATSIPLRFRLGSLEYVDRLEGKEKWIAPNIH